MKFDSLGFEARYEVLTDVGIPPAGSPVWFPPGWRRSTDGLVVRVVPETGPAWTGAFPGGGSLRGVFGTPRADAMLVVCGDGYLVPAVDPAGMESIGRYPVLEVRGIPEQGLLLLVSYTEICAYGKEGLRWKTRRLADDGISIASIADARVEGMAWSAPKQDWMPFSLDLGTGRVEGGGYQ